MGVGNDEYNETMERLRDRPVRDVVIKWETTDAGSQSEQAAGALLVQRTRRLLAIEAVAELEMAVDYLYSVAARLQNQGRDTSRIETALHTLGRFQNFITPAPGSDVI